MLKLKENIDFKNLEKYGFVKNSDNEYYKDNIDTNEILMIRPDRYILLAYTGRGFFGNLIEENALDDLFDLINDNLIEKG